jgi:hypothetical protein
MGLATIVAIGCGSDNPSGPSSNRTTVTRTGALNAGFATFEGFTSTSSGTVRVTLNWNSAANDLDMAVVANSCTSVSSVGSTSACTIIASADGLARPETLTFEAATNTAYKIAVGNIGPTSDTYTLTIDSPR